MKALAKALRGKYRIVFLDFEATQLEADLIAIGAIKADLSNDFKIKRTYRPFKQLVKTKHAVGPIVEKMTGLTNIQLNKEGVSFANAIDRLKKYVGPKYEEHIYCFYGSHDAHILNQSYLFDPLADINFLRVIRKNYLDFAAFLNRYISDEQGNVLSLTNMLKVFEEDPHGMKHDPVDDSYDLMSLYQAFTFNPEAIKENYEKSLSTSHKIPMPIRRLLTKLQKEGTVSKEDYDKFILEELS